MKEDRLKRTEEKGQRREWCERGERDRVRRERGERRVMLEILFWDFIYIVRNIKETFL